MTQLFLLVKLPRLIQGWKTMDNMTAQFLSGLIPFGGLIAFIALAIYTFKTKVLPNYEKEQNKKRAKNEQRNKN